MLYGTLPNSELQEPSSNHQLKPVPRMNKSKVGARQVNTSVVSKRVSKSISISHIIDGHDVTRVAMTTASSTEPCLRIESEISLEYSDPKNDLTAHHSNLLEDSSAVAPCATTGVPLFGGATIEPPVFNASHHQPPRATRGRPRKNSIVKRRSTEVDDRSGPLDNTPYVPALLVCCDICERRGVHHHNTSTIKYFRNTDATPLVSNQCDVCSGMLSSSTSEAEPFVCKSGLKMPFKCHQCGISFHRSDRLIAHSHIHTNKKAFPCLFCSIAFSRKNRLSSHTKASHSTEDPTLIGLGLPDMVSDDSAEEENW